MEDTRDLRAKSPEGEVAGVWVSIHCSSKCRSNSNKCRYPPWTGRYVYDPMTSSPNGPRHSYVNEKLPFPLTLFCGMSTFVIYHAISGPTANCWLDRNKLRFVTGTATAPGGYIFAIYSMGSHAVPTKEPHLFWFSVRSTS